MLVYYLILWILDHASDGNGYGFPLDRRYLNFYERLQAAQVLLNEVNNYYPKFWKDAIYQSQVCVLMLRKIFAISGQHRELRLF